MNLNLSEATITPEICQNLETTLPNVRSLNLRKASILELPAVWQEQLKSFRKQNSKLKRQVAEQALDIVALKDIGSRK